MSRRVLVTGIGVISAIGIGKDEFWRQLVSGASGISPITLFDTSGFNRHMAGEIKNFTPQRFISAAKLKFLGRASRFGMAAAQLALRDAAIPLAALKKSKTALLMGVTIPEGSTIDFSSEMMLKEKSEEVTKRIMLDVFAPALCRNMGYFLGLSGRNMLLPNACAAGNYCISYAYDMIRKEEIDVAIAGGAEALSRIAFQGFQRLYAMAPETCAPFDKNRKGMLLGEGAGVLILEAEEHARARGAKAYAEILGYGLSNDAHHMTIPKREGVGKAMRKALENSKVSPEQVDYISAHGTGTQANDKNEAAAIHDVFGPRARDIPVSSIKSMLGHTMGAASAIEAIACCLAIEQGIIPPTINFEEFDPDCDVDCVPNTARKKKINFALNNGFAFGGSNCSVLIGRV